MQAQGERALALPVDLRRDGRYVWLAIAGLLALHASLAWVTRAPGIETGQDDAVYVLLSRSLTHLEYRDPFVVGTQPNRQYPPGYPALLAVWQTVAGQGFDTLVLLSILASTVALALTYVLVRGRFSAGTALVCLVALALNPYLLVAAGHVASEAPYAMCSLLALWALSRPDAGLNLMAFGGAAAVVAALTRAAGVTLLLALGLQWLLERRFARVAMLAIGAAVTVGAWIFWTASAPLSYVGKTYLSDVFSSATGSGSHRLAQELVHRVAHNVPTYLGMTLPYLLPLPTVRGTVIDNVLDAAVTVAGLGAGLWVFARRWRLAALYLVTYAAMLAVWPWDAGRFIVPVLALVVPVVLIGCGSLANRFGAKWEGRTVLALGSVLALNAMVRTGRMIQARARCVRGPGLPSPTCVPAREATFFAALDYVEKHTPPDAVFVSAKPATLFYYTGRRSVPLRPALDGNAGSFVRTLERAGAQYVLLGSVQWSEPGQMAPLLSEDCRALSLVAGFPPSTYLLRINSAAQRSDDAACHALADYRRAHAGDDSNWGSWPP